LTPWSSCFFHVNPIKKNKKQNVFKEQSNQQLSVVSEKKIENKQHPFWHPMGLLFLSCISDQQTTFFKEPSNGHSYQVWFQLVKRFQKRRLKCKSLPTTTDNQDAK
jgi:hypothetical protein